MVKKRVGANADADAEANAGVMMKNDPPIRNDPWVVSL